MGLARPLCFPLFALLPASAIAAAAPGLLREHRPTAAILNANGGYVMEGRGKHMRKDNAQVHYQETIPTCKDKCTNSEDLGHAELVCKMDDGSCTDAHQSSCAPGMGKLCSQGSGVTKCKGKCSKWLGGSDETSVVCQNNLRSYLCRDAKTCNKTVPHADEEDKRETECAQVPIDTCAFPCDAYPEPFDETVGFEKVDHSSRFVCQLTEFPKDSKLAASSFNECYSLPCVGRGQVEGKYLDICRQTFPECTMMCAEGSTHTEGSNSWKLYPKGSKESRRVVCQNPINDVCTNDPECEKTNRCLEVFQNSNKDGGAKEKNPYASSGAE